MSKRKKFIIVLDLILIGAVIFMLGYWFAKSESNTLIRINGTVFWATILASTGPQTPVLQNTIRFSIRTNKTCYALHEPVEIWTELVNVGDEPITVMKAIHIFTGGGLYGLDPFVNGKRNSAMIQAFDEGEPWDDYVMLLPGEGSLVRISDFLYVIGDLDDKPKDSTTGQYDFAMEYKNWIPYVVDNQVFTGNRYLFQMYSDRPVWIGVIESNALTITIVDDPAKCSLADQDAAVR